MELKTWEVGFATTISLKAEDVIQISTVDGTVVTGKPQTKRWYIGRVTKVGNVDVY